MKKQFKFSLWVLLGCLLSSMGYAFIPPGASISPDRPTIDSNIKIGVTLRPCTGYSLSNPDFYHLSADNHITFVFVFQHLFPCPGGQPSFEREIGQLPAGEYTLQAYAVPHRSLLPTTINDPLGQPFYDLVRFTVYAPAISVPTIGFWGIGTMVLGVLLTLFWLRNKKLLFTVGLLLFCGSLSAKEFIILLSNQAGAPTPEQVVNQAAISPPPPSYLLSSFNSYTPNNVTYLLSDRPLGQRLDLVNNNPNWLLSKLYRYLIVSYADSVSDADLSAAFAADPHVEGMFDLRHLEVVTAADKAVKPNTPLRSFVGNFLSDLDIYMA